MYNEFPRVEEFLQGHERCCDVRRPVPSKAPTPSKIRSRRVRKCTRTKTEATGAPKGYDVRSTEPVLQLARVSGARTTLYQLDDNAAGELRTRIMPPAGMRRRLSAGCCGLMHQVKAPAKRGGQQPPPNPAKPCRQQLLLRGCQLKLSQTLNDCSSLTNFSARPQPDRLLCPTSGLDKGFDDSSSLLHLAANTQHIIRHNEARRLLS